MVTMLRPKHVIYWPSRPQVEEEEIRDWHNIWTF